MTGRHRHLSVGGTGNQGRQGLRIMDQLIGEATPIIHAKKNAIYVKGEPVRVDRLQSQFVAVIEAASGGWVRGKPLAEHKNMMIVSKPELLTQPFYRLVKLFLAWLDVVFRCHTMRGFTQKILRIPSVFWVIIQHTCRCFPN